ncbi:MAG: type II toxin-antitoxin system VapC family toxin [Verrucomicrobiaceae bacterium]|nr:type II toxin-antitoxin system VapC family toxin [Verrucomicrobiaceae bacterium]
MSSAYYDSNYLFKLQIAEQGSAEVCAHAASVLEIHSASHARAEFASAAFRKVREGVATPADYGRLIAQFQADIAAEAIVLLPLTDAILARVETVFATAAEQGFPEIYSSDRHLLAAAPLFDLAGVNVIP